MHAYIHSTCEFETAVLYIYYIMSLHICVNVTYRLPNKLTNGHYSVYHLLTHPQPPSYLCGMDCKAYYIIIIMQSCTCMI